MSNSNLSSPVTAVNIDDEPRPYTLTFVPHYRSGNSTRRKTSLAKRIKRCKLCDRAPNGVCRRHSKEMRRGV